MPNLTSLVSIKNREIRDIRLAPSPETLGLSEASKSSGYFYQRDYKEFSLFNKYMYKYYRLPTMARAFPHLHLVGDSHRAWSLFLYNQQLASTGTAKLFF